MKPVIRNILAIVAGVVVGSIVNMGFIMAGSSMIPPPPGADVSTTEGLKASIHLFETKHFIFPFLAHALGTMAGTAVAAMVAATHKFQIAMAIGVFFLLGGAAMVMMIPSPMWFNVLDLVAGYLPMAWIGYKLATRTTGQVRPA